MGGAAAWFGAGGVGGLGVNQRLIPSMGGGGADEGDGAARGGYVGGCWVLGRCWVFVVWALLRVVAGWLRHRARCGL